MSLGKLVGLDIGHKNVSAVSVSTNSEKVTLLKWGQTPLFSDGSYEDSDGSFSQALTEAVKKLWAEAGFTTRRVVVGDTTLRMALRMTDFPAMKERELKKAIDMELEQHFPFGRDEMVYNFAVADGGGDDQIEVLLAGAVREGIDRTLEGLGSARIKPLAFDVADIAAHRALVHPAVRIQCGEDVTAGEQHPPGVLVVVDLGHDESRVNIFDGDVPVVDRTVPVGGERLQAMVADREDVNGEALAFNPRVRGELQRVAHNVSISLQFYSANYRSGEIAGVYLTGGFSRFESVCDVLADHIIARMERNESLSWSAGKPVIKPVTAILGEGKQNETVSLSGPDYLTAVGLALWEVVG